MFFYPGVLLLCALDCGLLPNMRSVDCIALWIKI